MVAYLALKTPSTACICLQSVWCLLLRCALRLNWLRLIVTLQGYKRCEYQCLTCSEYGLSYCTSCRHYKQVDKCVEDCEPDFYLNKSSDHCLRCDKRCLGCDGPTPSQCKRCRHYTIYQDLGKGDEGVQSVCCGLWQHRGKNAPPRIHPPSYSHP